ncbi:tRNA pseudouridine(38-40) synthase TruA [Cohnella nanjingensis]|uniref:tRNA pseudouridine synthase A n=1 Tax=Cohnella nanjingensis TaxID=1387779 RepID=A0A7X0VIC8_9BACL|nr:tRNA pseudouridine(38-40) synthase TruA [Cohnella nanjingensis]MBB6675085.1 tRNA pseudouridine(38-40) synthase TruA [Cohnella nanjingensis]
MRNIALLVSYDGAAYYGYQSQPGGNTVQNKLEEAILKLSGEEVRLTGSGRTDAGVHAQGQVVNFYTASSIPAERWALALNSRLPDDIVVLAAAEVPEAFHARRSAVRKTYRYAINSFRFPDVFARTRVFHHPAPLRFAAMREGLSHLLGEHDFSSFTSPLSTKPHHIRTLYEASFTVERTGPGGEASGRGVGYLTVTGNGFLYNMVRIIAGTILQVGEGKRPPSAMADILAARDRAEAGPTAVPHALTLWEVEYGPAWALDWRSPYI